MWHLWALPRSSSSIYSSDSYCTCQKLVLLIGITSELDVGCFKFETVFVFPNVKNFECTYVVSNSIVHYFSKISYKTNRRLLRLKRTPILVTILEFTLTTMKQNFLAIVTSRTNSKTAFMALTPPISDPYDLRSEKNMFKIPPCSILLILSITYDVSLVLLTGLLPLPLTRENSYRACLKDK